MLSGDYDTFSDVERGTWYYAAVSALASAGIVSGYNGFFRPDDTLTSGELITMLTRFVEAKTALCHGYPIKAIGRIQAL